MQKPQICLRTLILFLLNPCCSNSHLVTPCKGEVWESFGSESFEFNRKETEKSKREVRVRVFPFSVEREERNVNEEEMLVFGFPPWVFIGIGEMAICPSKFA